MKEGVSEVRQEAARRIRKARDKTGLSQEKFANAVGLTRQAIADAEAGKYRMRDNHLDQIAEYVGCSIWDLIPQPPKLELIDSEEELKRAGRTGQSRRRKSVGRAQYHQTRASLRIRSAVA